MKNFVQKGEVLHYEVQPTDEIKSGDLVAVGDVVGVATTDGEAGKMVAVSVQGVYSVPVPAAAGAIAQGKALYFNATAKEISADPSGNIAVGYAWDAGVPGGVVPVKLKS